MTIISITKLKWYILVLKAIVQTDNSIPRHIYEWTIRQKRTSSQYWPMAFHI